MFKMKLKISLVTLILIGLGCSKEDSVTSNNGLGFVQNHYNPNVSIQENLDSNVIFLEVLAANPIDSFYGIYYQGGLIFHIDSVNTLGYIVSENIVGSQMRWKLDTLTITGANDTTIGGGKYNTDLIVNTFGSGNYAASVCNGLMLNGYPDWYLPTYNALSAIHSNLVNGPVLTGADYYWSSEECDAVQAKCWSPNFPWPSECLNKSLAQYRLVATRTFDF